MKKGITKPSPQWWKHLRDWKAIFWGRQRRADKDMIHDEMWSEETRKALQENAEISDNLRTKIDQYKRKKK